MYSIVCWIFWNSDDFIQKSSMMSINKNNFPLLYTVVTSKKAFTRWHQILSLNSFKLGWIPNESLVSRTAWRTRIFIECNFYFAVKRNNQKNNERFKERMNNFCGLFSISYGKYRMLWVQKIIFNSYSRKEKCHKPQIFKASCG